MDTVRAKAASPERVGNWIMHLHHVFQKYGIKPENIANADETSANLQDIEKNIITDTDSTVVIPCKTSRNFAKKS